MTKRFYITHADQYGERHQLSGAWEAETPEEAIRQMLSDIGEHDDGRWEAHEAACDADIID